MAKVIQFYVPKNFRKPLRWTPHVQCGKVIEFLLSDEKISVAGTGFRNDLGEGK